MIHRYNTIFRNYNYSKNTYKIETRDIAALAAIWITYSLLFKFTIYTQLFRAIFLRIQLVLEISRASM